MKKLLQQSSTVIRCTMLRIRYDEEPFVPSPVTVKIYPLHIAAGECDLLYRTPAIFMKRATVTVHSIWMQWFNRALKSS